MAPIPVHKAPPRPKISTFRSPAARLLEAAAPPLAPGGDPDDVLLGADDAGLGVNTPPAGS